MTVAPYTILVTGSNRGIGHALVTRYLLRPHHIVIASIRSPSAASTLTSLPRDPSTTLILSQIDSKDHSTPSIAISNLQAQGVNHLDLVIANAGVCKCFPTAAEANLDDAREHYEINVLGPLALFQATLPLLRAADSREGKFVGISSIGASIGGMELRPVPSSVYGPSKAALNYIMRKAHFENEDICVFVIEPGWPKTDMGNNAAKLFGVDGAEIEIEDSTKGLIAVIEAAKRETHSGRFLSYKGGDYPW